MDAQSAFQLAFDFGTAKPVVVEVSAAQISSDAGLLAFRQLDAELGLTRQFAEALTDRRHVGYIGHTFLEMVRMRVYGILADYADQNDHDLLRSDPVFKLVCDRNFANLFRLYLHTAAYNLLARMRQAVEEPLPPDRVPSGWQEVPVEALAGRRHRQHHNRRRTHDPLGQGQPCTWRTRLIKVAALVYESTRRVVVRLSSSWPYLGHYQQVSQRILTLAQTAPDTS